MLGYLPGCEQGCRLVYLREATAVVEASCEAPCEARRRGLVLLPLVWQPIIIDKKIVIDLLLLLVLLLLLLLVVAVLLIVIILSCSSTHLDCCCCRRSFATAVAYSMTSMKPASFALVRSAIFSSKSPIERTWRLQTERLLYLVPYVWWFCDHSGSVGVRLKGFSGISREFLSRPSNFPREFLSGTSNFPGNRNSARPPYFRKNFRKSVSGPISDTQTTDGIPAQPP